MKAYSGGFISPNAVAGACLGQLWTPTRRVRLLEAHVTASNTALSVALQRTSARGTATTTIGVEGHDGNDEASGVFLDRVFSVEPTYAGNSLADFTFPGTAGNEAVDWEFYNQLLWIPAGAGIALKNISGVTAQGHEIFLIWEE